MVEDCLLVAEVGFRKFENFCLSLRWLSFFVRCLVGGIVVDADWD